MGITGRTQLKLKWLNFSDDDLNFTPAVTFDFEGRQILGGSWLELSNTMVPSVDQVSREAGVGYSYIKLSDHNITWIDLINISSNLSINKSLVLEKIELVFEVI